MENWLYRINIEDIWNDVKKDKISVYKFVELFLKRLEQKSFYKKFIDKDFELEDIISDFDNFLEEQNTDKDEFDEIWSRFYDWADGIKLWVNIF